MKLTASRPVTVDRVRHGERWFPFLYRHTDGSLLMYVAHGHDRHFTPCHRLKSIDGGKLWLEEEQNLPRLAICHSFADGELFEIDSYGFEDPKSPGTFAYYGAWSHPATPSKPVKKELVRLHAPAAQKTPFTSLARGPSYPAFHWWPLYNGLHGKDELTGDEIVMGGPYLTTAIETDGRLLSIGYMADAAGESFTGLCSPYLFESRDRGRNWEQKTRVAHGDRSDATPEGLNETTLVQLKDGRLYAIMRGGKQLHHVWSSDGGKSWTSPAPLTLADDPKYAPGMAWPVCRKLEDGTLVLVYGRPGKHVIFDPSGTGTKWQGRLDLHAWELDTQALMGVPAEERLRGPTHLGVRYWDSGDYLGLVATGPREVLVVYDVHTFVESWNAVPVEGVRMVRVRLED